MLSESPKHNVAKAYERGDTLELDALHFGSDPAQMNLCLDHRFELNSEVKVIVEMTRTNISSELCARLLNCQDHHALRSEVLACYVNRH